MTEFDIQRTLFNRFLLLNDFSSIEFIKFNESGDVINVAFPNSDFSVPTDKRYFRLTLQSGEHEPVGIMEGTQIRFAGLLYIDIFTPIDTKEEAENSYKHIARLFNSEKYIDDVEIEKVYISTKGNDNEFYRLQVAVEWSATIDEEV